MEIPSVLISDTHGSLASDLFKIHVDNPAISARLTDEEEKTRTLNISLDNIRLDSVPNISNSTYKTFLTYNGSLGYTNKVFTTVVKEASGIFDPFSLPVLSYNPGQLVKPEASSLEDIVIDIKMYNGTVDVLRYSEGILNNGEKSYFVKEKRSYPVTVTGLPNVSGNKVMMDGWYSYTSIIFRDASDGALMIKGNFYGRDGFIFKASDNGNLFSNTSTGKLIIMREGDNTLSDGIVQVKNENYEQLLFSLNETTGTSAHGNNVFIHSQIMVTDQIRDSITAEAVEAAFACDGDFVDFQNWQKLTLKRMAAYVMFQNGLFENAQIILESARAICSPSRYNSTC